MRLSLIVTLVAGMAAFSLPASANELHHSAAASASAVSPQVTKAVGTVRGIDAENKKITIDHDAIASLGWPAMRMRFTYTEAAPQFTDLKEGDKVSFTFIQQENISLLQSISVR
ncbi:copper-binding protein [Morganella psychrotolerans]|uniref:copper-binding protein n=1 Tax=Morganella psychrotolerans TaxID=368603 RepID=UPI0039B00049